MIIELLTVKLFQNPPWQIVTYNDAGEVASMRGISVNILDELSEKLNFSYEYLVFGLINYHSQLIELLMILFTFIQLYCAQRWKKWQSNVI